MSTPTRTRLDQALLGQLASLDPRLPQLYRAAVSVAANAHAPRSGTHVGAALLTEAGAVHAGCNVELAARGVSLCAEQAALATACGTGDHAAALLLVVKGARVAALPCGACRQMLYELAPDVSVVVRVPSINPTDASVGSFRLAPLRELLPGRDDLSRWMEPDEELENSR